MTRSYEDDYARDISNAVDGLVDIINGLKDELAQANKELTMKDDIIASQEEEILRLQTEAAETITATITNE